MFVIFTELIMRMNRSKNASASTSRQTCASQVASSVYFEKVANHLSVTKLAFCFNIHIIFFSGDKIFLQRNELQLMDHALHMPIYRCVQNTFSDNLMYFALYSQQVHGFESIGYALHPTEPFSQHQTNLRDGCESRL